MKKLLLQIITLVLAVSCQVTELTPVRDMTDDCLYGTMESMNATKTSMDENNNILWSEGDQLVAFMKTTLGRKYQIQEEYVGSTTGGFSRVTEESSGDDFESGNELSHNVVLYPYASTSCMKNDGNETSNSYKVNLNLPEIQTYAVGSFGNGSFPMIAVSSSNELLFKNICGGIKLQFKGEDKIKSIKLESIGGEKISGKATVIGYADETVPTTIMAEEAVSSVTLDCGDGVQLSDEPTTFIISVPPVVFESGMKITVTDTDGISRELTNTSKNTIKRSTLLTFPVITYTQTGVFELAEGTLTSYEVKAEGGTIEIPVVTNQDYQVVIPENAAEWITVVATRALREETITLNITENTNPGARSAEVLIATTENVTLQTITISQEAGIDFANAIDLSMSGSANSYIVSETGVYKFPAVKGNSSESVGTVESVEVLWESFGTSTKPSAGDLVKSASYFHGFVVFSTANTFAEGNAVIAAKDASGTILWSWHIWLTNKPADEIYDNNAGIMMSRNLGSTGSSKYGLYYQWGRKDPFSYSGKSTITWPSRVESSAITGTVDYVTQNPTTYVYGTWSTEQDWHFSNRDNTLWGSEKTIYDPCPAGYRVPDASVWANAGIGNMTYGMTWEDEGRIIFMDECSPYYPYAARGSEGFWGYYWSVTPAQYLWLYWDDDNDSPAGIGGEDNRSNAYSVRCMKKGSGIVFDLSTKGTANSYIVSESGWYKFDAVKGNSRESVGLVAYAEVLWESFGTNVTPKVGDLVRNVSYSDGKISFQTADTFKEGNAVIAARDASGTILWSWHIWLTDEPKGQVYYNNAGTMMDRNLGATSATPGDVSALGLLYQWGRKDPFLGSSSIYFDSIAEAKSTISWPSTVSSSSSKGTIEYATAHPTTFICRNSNNNDWYYTGNEKTDNTRWSESTSDKSVYDPCPVGWRVPDGETNSVWSKALGSSSSFTGSPLYSSSNRGLNFSGTFGANQTIWYPATGSRSFSDGKLGGVGNFGMYKSSSPNINGNYYAYVLYFNNFSNDGNVYPVYSECRAYGDPVRCISENSVPDVPGEPSEPEPSQPSYSVLLKPDTYGWVKSSTVPNPDASLYDGVYESTNQGQNDTQSVMYIDINGYDEFTIYVRSYAESTYDYVLVSNLDTDISSVKTSTCGNQKSGTSLSSYTKVTFTNIGGGQHRIMVVYKKDYSQHSNDDKGYVLIPKNQDSGTSTEPLYKDYVDEYGINHGQGVEIDGVVWAPVNCGYHASDYQYGKLYQWGRKYGQGYLGSLYDYNGNSLGIYSDALSPSIVSGPVSLDDGQSKSNANKFYTSSSAYNYDWVKSKNDALWNRGTEDNPVKTDYDPCPQGWRVPTKAELNSLTLNYSSWTTNNDQSGRWFSGTASYSSSVPRIFLPGAGCRYTGSDSGVRSRGVNGFYWSSGPNGTEAYRLVFSGNVNKSGGIRASGFSVRCVQE